MTDERQAGLLDRQIEEFMGWLFRDGGAEPPRREYDAVEQRLRLFLLSEAVAQVPAEEEWLRDAVEDILRNPATYHDVGSIHGRLRRALGVEPKEESG